MRIVAISSILFCLAAAACSPDHSLAPPPNVPVAAVPVNLVAVSPTDVTGIVGTAVANAPAVRVTDKNGSPVAGVTVAFIAGQEAGTLAASEARTDSDGVARSGGWILGKLAIRHVVTAQSTALPGKSATFSSMAVARGLKSISRYAGDRQIADVGTSIRFPLAVFASDTFGNPLASIPISFAVVSGGGTIDQTPVTTNADGVGTSNLMKLGAQIGDEQVVASTGGVSTTFTVYARQPLSSCALLNCSGSRLAFVRDGDIYTASADGSNPIRLTKGIEPAWSADGRIAFTGTGGVYVMNEDGSNVRLVAPGGASSAWSPDAQRIAFVTPTIDGQAVEVVPVDVPMANPVRIGFDRGLNEWPTWSPDGSRIAFDSDWTAFDFATEVFVADQAGKSAEQLTNGFFGSVASWPTFLKYSRPAWSPDGTKIAHTQCSSQYWICEESSLVVTNADGTGSVMLTAAHGYLRPSWSPSGKWITYDGPSGIQFISLDGIEHGILIPNAQSATWRP